MRNVERQGAGAKILVAGLLAACVPEAAIDGVCRTARDCGAEQLCLAGACTDRAAAHCEVHDDCPGGSFCDRVSMLCLDTETPSCRGDEGCPPGERCDVSRGVCLAPDELPVGQLPDPISADIERTAAPLAPACGEDAECAPPNTVCLDARCALGCGNRGGLSCGGTEVCDTTTGRCVPLVGPCQTDADCGAPAMVCEGSQCVRGCAAPMGGIQCVGNTSCNPSSGRCDGGPPPPPPPPPTGCTDDAREPDDDRGAARTLSPGAQSGLVACPSDDDFGAVALEVGDALAVELESDPGEGDVDLALFDASGAQVARATGADAVHRLTLTARSAGVHTVRVWLASDAGTTPGAGYTLRVTVTQPPPPPVGCAADRYEENDSLAQSRRITPGSHANLSVCLDSGVYDDDYYAVVMRGGEVLTATIRFRNAEGNIDMVLQDTTGAALIGSWTRTDDESIRFSAPSDGTYYLYVYLDTDTGSQPGNQYSLDLSVAR